MKIKKFPFTKFNQLNDLVYVCFKDDHVYRKEHGDKLNDKHFVYEMLSPVLWASLIYGNIYGAMEYGDLIGFLAYIDYTKFKEERSQRLYKEVFPPMYEKLVERLDSTPGKVMYSVLMGVTPKERRRGIAAAMLDKLIETYPEYTIVSGVSNKSVLSMYEKRGFQIERLDKDYYFVKLAPRRSSDVSAE